MRGLPDRYKTVGRRDFASAVDRLLETEFKLVGSHRVIRLMVQAIMELHREFFPETKYQTPGTILWATTKAGEGAKVSWGKRAEDYGIQLVQLPLVTEAEIQSRMIGGPGRDPKDNRRKEFRRDMATAVRLIKSTAEQGGLLTGAEVSVLMNRSLMKVHDYVRTYEQETGDPLPLKGYVLDMGSSPTHKGIICRKYEEGLSPPDIARATGHTLSAVDNYLGTYDRIKVLLRKGLDVPTICQVTGRAARTVAQYLVIVEVYQPKLLKKVHRDWLDARRKKSARREFVPPESVAPVMQSLKKGGTLDPPGGKIVASGVAGEADSKNGPPSKGRTGPGRSRKKGRNK